MFDFNLKDDLGLKLGRIRYSIVTLCIISLINDYYVVDNFLHATTHLYPSLGPPVRPYVPCYIQTNMTVFEGKKSSINFINETMSDDEVVVANLPPRYLLPSKTDIFVIGK